mmetsp:Transcript_3718/g.7671  ORF Transcript_3718/g.7671 Transcript_3718/m.7671 type:complete len:305 (+) Transcript_3718:694-1608(+)
MTMHSVQREEDMHVRSIMLYILSFSSVGVKNHAPPRSLGQSGVLCINQKSALTKQQLYHIHLLLICLLSESRKDNDRLGMIRVTPRELCLPEGDLVLLIQQPEHDVDVLLVCLDSLGDGSGDVLNELDPEHNMLTSGLLGIWGQRHGVDGSDDDSLVSVSQEPLELLCNLLSSRDKRARLVAHGRTGEGLGACGQLSQVQLELVQELSLLEISEAGILHGSDQRGSDRHQPLLSVDHRGDGLASTCGVKSVHTGKNPQLISEKGVEEDNLGGSDISGGNNSLHHVVRLRQELLEVLLVVEVPLV